MESIDYWRRNYDELTPESNQEARRAHEIFNRLVRAAGSRPGVVPRLFIAKSEPKNISLPISIPDGSVIISAKTLEICGKDPTLGDDRLAFVLGHELAHLLKDDFWHMKFFSALKSEETEKSTDAQVLSQLREIAGSTDQVLAKELQADEFGIIYASMAGFNTSAIVNDDGKVNFFAEWLKAADPEYSEAAPKDPTHPTPEQRAETVRARLRQVLKNVQIFDLGVVFYQTGQFDRAAEAFEKFSTYFPSREVYHNLGASYHQLALKSYSPSGGHGPMLFKMSLSIDPTTRAKKITLRGGDDRQQLFEDRLQKAMDLYRRAISEDPAYVLSYNNLACALILRGREGDAYKAIGLLKDSLRLDPERLDTLNTLGVAFYYAENPAKAMEYFLEAHKIDPAYDLPLFNLGRLALETGKESEGRQYMLQYLELDKTSHWAAVARKLIKVEGTQQAVTISKAEEQPPEKVLGLRPGASDEELPREWGEPKTDEVALDRYPYRIGSFPNRLMTVSRRNRVEFIVASSGFAGKTAREVGMGSTREEIISRYGEPSGTLDSSQGFTLVYDSPKVSFNFRGGRLVSWVLF
jgi:tetratricopeptide (TPR) repeat protein